MSEVFVFVLLSLAAFRVQHFITSDTFPGAWVRYQGAARGGQRLEEFVSCHYCLGSYITFATFAVAAQIVSMRLPVLQALAGAAVVGLLGEWETRLGEWETK